MSGGLEYTTKKKEQEEAKRKVIILQLIDDVLDDNRWLLRENIYDKLKDYFK